MMITTLICCFCIVCTAVISTYGAAARPSCIAFSLAFSSGSLLISAVYYAIIKVTLLAMGTVLELKKGRICMRANRHNFIPVPKNQSSDEMPPPQQPIDGKEQEQEIVEEEEWSFSDSDDDGDSYDQEKHCEPYDPRNVAAAEAASPVERFSTIKVWTNVYGLALGTFCMVHSLMLPNELSNTVFCICLWLEGSLEECCSRSISPRRSSSRKVVVGSASAACISLLLLAGIVTKSTGSFISGKLDIPFTAWDYSSIIIPIIGVAAIRNMSRTNDIRATMELSSPACLLGSIICFLVCIFVSFSDAAAPSSCMVDHLLDLDNDDASLLHGGKNSTKTRAAWIFLRHEPILSILTIPFPLVCSVVAIVTCSQTSHAMVSLPLFDSFFFFHLIERFC